jgi:predicted O-methyltransferase YrrM
VIDDKVQAVLDAYHARADEEMRQLRERPPGGGIDDVRDQLLLAVGPETGRLLNILARSLAKPNILELGTSYGYSGIWLAEAARAREGRVTTMELADYKSKHAREMSAKAGLAAYVDFKIGDAVKGIGELSFRLDFVLVDLWKDMYVPCLEAFYPKLNPGAIVVADNMRVPDPVAAKRYQDAVRAKPGMTSVMLPVGSGIEISRFQP